MRLQRLTSIEVDKIVKELDDLIIVIKDLKEIIKKKLLLLI